LLTLESSWTDARGSLYGPVPQDFSLVLQPRPALVATLSDVLWVDADGNLVVTPGDAIRYTVTVQNTGGTPVSDVVLDLAVDRHGSSIFALGTLAGGASAVVTRDVVIDAEVPLVTAQGTVTSALAPVLTNLALTPVLLDAPVLTAELVAELAFDADRDGGPSSGDTLRYTLLVTNPGLRAADDVVFDLDPGPHLLIAPISESLGTISGSDAVELAFEAEVVGGPGTLVSVQGMVSGLLTDDPTVPGEADPTATFLGGTVNAPGSPLVTLLTPVDGARQGSPVEITATASESASWTLFLEGTVLASGTGPLPATLGTFDPTLLENGLWTLRLEVADALGRIGADEVVLEVAGDAKLGAYDLAFLEAEWSAGPTAISLVRSYTTLRKDTVGDFGHGWELAMTDFTVQVNGPLGEDGWSQQICAGHLFFNEICTVSAQPYLVLVRWPDGHVESFDLSPTPGSTFFSPLTTAAYTPRPGATSTLTPAPGDDLLVFVEGDLYTDLSARYVYDPRQFVLTDNRGTSYLLDVDLGLVEMTDPQGNLTLFTEDGIFPELGEGVTFDRDGEGRIEAMNLPDGSAVSYVYADGDLVEVIDGEGNAMAFSYDDVHRLVAYNVAGQPPIAEMVYDADGRLISAVDDGGVLVETNSSIDPFQQVVTGPDPRLTTTTTYDADGQAIEVVQAFDGEAFVTSMTWNADFWMESRTLPTGATESWTYDAQGRVLVHTDPAGVVRESIYGPDGQVAVSLESGEIVEETVFEDDLPSLVYRGDGTLLRREVYDADGC
jgi:YD repeat-containing protein